MSQKKQTLNEAIEEKFGTSAFNFTKTNGSDICFFINPSSQTAIFNFLVYDDQWKYDVLKDLNLLYEPNHPVAEYMLQYVVASRLHKENLQVHLPVEFSSGKANSLAHLYKTAEKLEQIVTEIYNISFVSKKIKLDDLQLNQLEKAAVITAHEKNIQKNQVIDITVPVTPETATGRSFGKVKKVNKELLATANIVTANVEEFTAGFAAEKSYREERKPVSGEKKLFAMLSYTLPQKKQLKVILLYSTPLMLALSLFFVIKQNGTLSENRSTELSESTVTTPVSSDKSSDITQSDYSIVLPSDNKQDKLIVNSAAVMTSAKEPSQKAKDEKLKRELLANNNNDQKLPLPQQPNNLLSPASQSKTFLPLKTEGRPILPVDVVKEDEKNASTPPVVTEGVPTDKTKDAAVIPAVDRADEPKANEAQTAVAVRQKPEFPGGSAAMAKYLRNRLKMPEEAADNNINGNVLVKFMVDEKGYISNIELPKKIGYGCDEVVEQVIKAMPKWIPGKVNGKIESMPVTLSVKFLVKGNPPNPKP